MKQLDATNKKIIDLAEKGKVSKVIARELNLARKTVDNRLYEMRKQFNCSTTKELIYILKGINALT